MTSQGPSVMSIERSKASCSSMRGSRCLSSPNKAETVLIADNRAVRFWTRLYSSQRAGWQVLCFRASGETFEVRILSVFCSSGSVGCAPRVPCEPQECSSIRSDPGLGPKSKHKRCWLLHLLRHEHRGLCDSIRCGQRHQCHRQSPVLEHGVLLRRHCLHFRWH